MLFMILDLWQWEKTRKDLQYIDIYVNIIFQYKTVHKVISNGAEVCKSDNAHTWNTRTMQQQYRCVW